jgi:hypothetical protein
LRKIINQDIRDKRKSRLILRGNIKKSKSENIINTSVSAILKKEKSPEKTIAKKNHKNKTVRKTFS